MWFIPPLSLVMDCYTTMNWTNDYKNVFVHLDIDCAAACMRALLRAALYTVSSINSNQSRTYTWFKQINYMYSVVT